jgi:hypothetical protein
VNRNRVRGASAIRATSLANLATATRLADRALEIQEVAQRHLIGPAQREKSGRLGIGLSVLDLLESLRGEAVLRDGLLAQPARLPQRADALGESPLELEEVQATALFTSLPDWATNHSLYRAKLGAGGNHGE